MTTECPPGWQDDNFLVFQNRLSTALMAVWTALMAIALVEFAIAQVRRTDNSPMVVRVPYFTWLVIATAVFSYGVARPLANVLDTTDAAVLLTLVSLRTIVLTIVKIQINMTLILTLQRGLHQRQHTRSDDYNTHARSIKRMHVVVRIVSVPNFVLSALAVIVFLSILPNVSGVTSTPVDRLEMFLMAGWLAMAVMILFQLLGGIFNYRIRGIIQENLALRPLPEVATATSPSSSLGVPSAGYTPLDNKMVQLERRMFKNTIRLCIITFVSVVLLFIAAIIGMQYWVFHMLAALHSLVVINVLGYYRLSLFATFRPRGAIPTAPLPLARSTSACDKHTPNPSTTGTTTSRLPSPTI